MAPLCPQGWPSVPASRAKMLQHRFNLCRIRCLVNRHRGQIHCSGYAPAGLTIVTKAPQQNTSGVRGALVNIILPYAFLCYGSPCESAGVSSARNRFSALCLSGTPPLGIDILSTGQQHFVLSRRFSLDRNFAVVYIAPSDSGDRDSASGRPIHPGNTATSSDATCRVKPRHRGGLFHSPSPALPALPARRSADP